jgi:hypothetical protein
MIFRIQHNYRYCYYHFIIIVLHAPLLLKVAGITVQSGTYDFLRAYTLFSHNDVFLFTEPSPQIKYVTISVYLTIISLTYLLINSVSR